MLDGLEAAARGKGWRVSRIDGSDSAAERQARAAGWLTRR